MSKVLQNIKRILRVHASPERKRSNESFFKTGPGEYGEGDKFIGVSVPAIRSIAREFAKISMEECARLLHEPIHEERLCALLILIEKFKKTLRVEERARLHYFYRDHVDSVNNWDLVDLSAPKIIGAYCFEINNYEILYEWINDENLWKRRIALVATLYLIKQGQFEQILDLAIEVLNDRHDLIHKAAGWMLREVGKSNNAVLITFLNQYYKDMPRTMLRYAIERLEEVVRQDYLKGRV